MPEKPAPQKIIAIDLLRALAALGVFYYHNHLGHLAAKYSGLPFLNATDSFGAVYAVPLFFLISGYCIHLANLKYLKQGRTLPLMDYYKRRFLRIYPPYLAALIVAIAINYFTYSQRPAVSDAMIHVLSVQGFTANYFTSINVVLWTISVEIAFYIIYPIFYYVRFKYSLNKALLFTFGVSCISILFFSLKYSLSNPERFCVFNLWFAWCCGAYLADKNILQPAALRRPVYLLAYFVILAACIYLNFAPDNLPIVFDQFNILVWTAPLIFLLRREGWLRERQNLWVIKIMAAIGLSSYSLYLLHEPLIELKNYLVHLYLPAQMQLAGLVMGIIIIPVISWYNYKYVEKPFMVKKRSTVIDDDAALPVPEYAIGEIPGK